MRTAITLATLGIYLAALSPAAAVAATKHTPPKPVCAEGQVATPLASAPDGQVCLEQYFADTLPSNLQGFEDQLKAGEDVQPLLATMQKEIETPEFAESYRLQQQVLLDRTTKLADDLCAADKREVQVVLPKDGQLYTPQFGLTPSCQVAGGGTAAPGSSTLLSVSFRDAGGASRIFKSNSSTFPTDFHVAETGTGAHTVTCAYRPNYCQTARTASRTVTIKAAAQSVPQKHSIARVWNDQMLAAIRVDNVRPPVQARNLFHLSAATYDIWALAHPTQARKKYLLGGNFCPLPAGVGTPTVAETQAAISYAAYRLISKRFAESPGYAGTVASLNAEMSRLGYDPAFTGKQVGQATVRGAALGNLVADCYLRYGRTDGSNERGSHANTAYKPRNEPVDPQSYGNPSLTNWDNWQPIALQTFVDQGGNTVSGGAEDFLGAEWGRVKPFALRADQKHVYRREGAEYPVYLDPGPPPPAEGGKNAEYKWNFALVGAWSGHLDPNDGVMWDASPGKLGATAPLPTTWEGLHSFFDLQNGGTLALGRPVNPKTGQPYSSNFVRRGDYTRALAEFWADGPTSETPPGHWFLIFNTVSDSPQLTKKLWGKGEPVDALTWDVLGYFTLGGALHDAAIAAWGAKGWYDGIRPVSALRAMAGYGQSSDPKLASYDPRGLPLIPGVIELIAKGDPLAGRGDKNVGKVKLRAWRGPSYIPDPETDVGGVDWILAGSWWPYQRPSFVTPPFGGYLSGHSTFSRAAAEVLTAFTGDEYFPGGLFTVDFPAHNYLAFENGPSKDLELQYATYVDAADSCSLSRIWGGIHPPFDDIPGRLLGAKVGQQAIAYARSFFAEAK